MVKRSQTGQYKSGDTCVSRKLVRGLAGGIAADGCSANPYEPDHPTDSIRVMTQRQLNRIISVAAESGFRFGRSQDSSQATSWMFTPWPLFDGRPAHSACLDREKFLRAISLHRSAAPLLVTPEELDASLDGDAGMVLTHKAAAVQSCGRRASLADLGLGRTDLFTATIVEENVRGHVHIFAAFLAVDEQEARDRLEIRVGASLTSAATICRGFDPSEPIAASLLSDAVAHTLSDIAQEPTSSLAAGLDLLVEHRFAV